MSLDVPPRQGLPTDDQGDLFRLEEITTTPKTLPEGARHGAAGSFVLNDDYRPASELQFRAGNGRNIPDGSLYQAARAARYEYENALITDPKGRERAILSWDYEIDGERHAVTLLDSRWRGGKGHGENYRPWYKYDLTVQPLAEDGEAIAWNRTPAKALNVKIQPQQEGMVNSQGEPVNIPYGPGSLVWVQATWVDDADELLERASRLVEVLGYELNEYDIAPESRKFWKAEVHHRVSEDVAERLAQVVHQSQQLLARHGANVDNWGNHENNRWMEAAAVSEDWELLGFPITNVPILIKLYYPDNPAAVDYPLDQPKLEVALAGGDRDDRKLSWDQWDRIMGVLEEILLSHLAWANVGREDLVADDFSDGPAAPPVTFAFPDGRRAWLRNYYQSLIPDLFREAKKEQTRAVYDILRVVQCKESVTYEELIRETGLAYRTVREHVSRLCDLGGDDLPGILTKTQGQCTYVSLSSRYFEEVASDALDRCYPEDTLEDLDERAQQRREQRRERASERADQAEVERAADEGGADEAANSAASPTWALFSEVSLTPDQLGRALKQDFLPPDHVKVRTDESPLFAGG